MNKLVEILKVESEEIATSFKKASIEGEGTPQEVADRREEIVKKFLAKYFPFPYRITKGNIIDSYGRRSNSIDCIILNPSHPYTIDPSNDKASIIFADGVDYAIEIKPDLANKTEIERALTQIQSVKKLRRKRNSLLLVDDKERIEYSKVVPCFIFSDKTYVDVKVLISHIVDFYVNNSVPKKEQFDMIVINNRMIIFNFKKNSYLSYNDFEGIAFAETNNDTFAMFLLFMNKIPKSEPEISQNIISIYLENHLDSSLSCYNDLNLKLKQINEKVEEE